MRRSRQNRRNSLRKLIEPTLASLDGEIEAEETTKEAWNE
jgi:hypothetical protein